MLSKDQNFSLLSLLNDVPKLPPDHHAFLKHDLIKQFGSPNVPLHIDNGSFILNQITFDNALILPIYNGQLELIQCAISQNKTFKIFPEPNVKGFTYLGDLQKNKPVIITYDLEAFFKVASCGFAVVLAPPTKLQTNCHNTIDNINFDRIQNIANQLVNAGYQQLYLPCRANHINHELFKRVEQIPNLRLLNQMIEHENEIFELNQEEMNERVVHFLNESIHLLQTKSDIPKGHLAKPMMLDDGYFQILKKGLFKVKINENGDEKKYLITSPILLLGEARNEKNANWQKLVLIIDKDNIEHKILLPYESLLGDALEALRTLVNHGMTPPTNRAKSVLLDYLNNYPIEARFICVSRAGWHGESYITSNKTYGSGNYVLNSENINPYSTKGSFNEWQKLSMLIEHHKLGVFTFSAAFSGQLLELLNEESGGFHIYGNSTDGKSTLTKAACSVWGSPFDGQNKYPNSWRTTDNALENNAEIRNDCFMVLDELKQATAKTVSNVSYMLANNDGKERMSKSTKNLAKKTWNLIYLSTGEITLSEHLRRDNLTLDAGQELRFAHIPSDQLKGLGVFDTLANFNSAQEIASQIKTLASQNYGHAGDQWLNHITVNKNKITALAKAMMDTFIKDFADGLNNQIKRVAKRFAIVACAGELATQAKITGWQSGRAYEAVGLCFKSWLNEFGSTDNIEEKKILNQIKHFFELHGTSRFEPLEIKRNAFGEEIRPIIHNRVGYYDEKKKAYLISTNMFENELCKGFNATKAKEILRRHAWIICEEGRFTKRVSSNLPDGTRPSLMHFSSLAMQKLNDDAFESQNTDVTNVTNVSFIHKQMNYSKKN